MKATLAAVVVLSALVALQGCGAGDGHLGRVELGVDADGGTCLAVQPTDLVGTGELWYEARIFAACRRDATWTRGSVPITWGAHDREAPYLVAFDQGVPTILANQDSGLVLARLADGGTFQPASALPIDGVLGRSWIASDGALRVMSWSALAEIRDGLVIGQRPIDWDENMFAYGRSIFVPTGDDEGLAVERSGPRGYCDDPAGCASGIATYRLTCTEERCAFARVDESEVRFLVPHGGFPRCDSDRCIGAVLASDATPALVSDPANRRSVFILGQVAHFSLPAADVVEIGAVATRSGLAIVTLTRDKVIALHRVSYDGNAFASGASIILARGFDYTQIDGPIPVVSTPSGDLLVAYPSGRNRVRIATIPDGSDVPVHEDVRFAPE